MLIGQDAKHVADDRLRLFFWELADRYGRVGPGKGIAGAYPDARVDRAWSGLIVRPSRRRWRAWSAAGRSRGAGGAGCC
jgi:hypothetical protein